MRTIEAFALRRERRIWGALAAALTLSGCSMPIPGLIDPSPTGSVRSPTFPFAAEDWGKAEAAVIAAIRAGDGDDPAAWSNEDSGRHGVVAGIGARFSKGGATCRAFVARIVDNGASRAVEGEACEKAGGATLSDAGPLRGV